MSTCRRGSILLFCLALVGALAVLAYGFVRVAQLHRASGDSGNLRLLANEAAVMGVDHAIEQILRDYVDETGTTPVTAMDGPAMRAFTTHDMPSMMSSDSDDEILGTRNGAAAVNLDDMPVTDGFDRLQLGYFQNNDGENPLPNGYLASSGRGRFLEPEFYNRAVPTAAGPSVPVRFGDVTVPLPDRNAGIFYDDRLCRIPGPQLAARERARYRLRYAVVTVDLEGQILVNGDPGVDHRLIDNPDPRAIADPAAARVVRNMHRLPSIVDAFERFGQTIPNNQLLSGGSGAGVIAEHVFTGRGPASNIDRRRDRGSAPLSFPLMYRKNGEPTGFIPAWGGDGTWPGADLYTDTGVLGRMEGGEEVPDSASPIRHMLTGPQFTSINWMYATGQSALDRYTPYGRGMSAAEAGEPISRYRGKVDTPWSVNLLTVTPRVLYGMVAGYMPPGGIALRYSVRAGAPVAWKLEMKDDPADANPDNLHLSGATTLTLTGGSGTIRLGYAFTLAGDPNRYRVLSAATSAHWDPVKAAAGVQQCVITVAPGLVLPNDNSPPAGADTYLDGTDATFTIPASFYAATRTRDLFVKQLSPAFDRYQAPQRNAAGPNPAIQPDYHVDDFWKLPPAATTMVFRGPADRYPGVMGFNGFNPDTVHTPGNASDMEDEWLHDTLGVYLRATNTGTKDASDRWIAVQPRTMGVAEVGSHAAGAFWSTTTHPNTSTIQPNCADTLTPTAPYTPSKPSRVGPHPDSIWEVIGQAMGATACAVQGQWLSYPNAKTGIALERFPAKWFDGAPWSGARVATIRDVDALFVANLGSNFSQPNDPVPVKAWYGGSATGLKSFTPEWNLAKLRTAKASTTATHDLMALNDPTEPGYVMAGTTVPVPGATDSAVTERSYVGGIPGSTTFTATERTQLAELIINDVRLSFFGSSPQYGDAFRALDLNGDGKAACSGFRSNGMATAREIALAIDLFTTSVDAGGIATVPVDTWFSNTGCFILGKSRFWHIMVRGEVWDNLAKCTVDRAQLDTVLCVDPVGAANEIGTAGPQDAGGGQYSTHIIYQSWVHNDMREFLSRRY